MAHKKNRVCCRLEGVQKVLAFRPTAALLKLEVKLKDSLNEVLRQKEMTWLQKSRVQWIKGSDLNTKFFHTSTIIRRKRNKIEGLLDENH